MERDLVDITEGKVRDYLIEILALFNQGNITEVSYYPALKDFLEQICLLPQLKVIMNPKEKWGLPDFIIKSGELTIGFIECKTPNVSLEEIIKTEQIKRYVEAFPNLCITNFIEFIFIKKEGQSKKIVLSTLDDLKKNRLPSLKKQYLNDLIENLLEFLTFKTPLIKDVETLTFRLSKLTAILKTILARYYNQDTKEFSDSSLQNLYLGFKNTLVENIKGEEFCDALAQTLSYCLLLAWNKDVHNQNISLSSVWNEIPKSIPVLIEIFTQFMIRMPIDVRLCCENIFELIANTNIREIFSNFEEDERDPTLYFYEDFLKAYNPKLKKIKGIYYTPVPIVKFITSSINAILKKTFKISDGLLNTNVRVLDPCAGTMTFIIEAIRIIYNNLQQQNNIGRFESLVREHILQNFYAFEILVAPYAFGHFKIRELLRNLGVELTKEDSFNLYLTNTLETRLEQQAYGFPSLIEESKKANVVKVETPILAIMGNPPYRIGSTNKHNVILNLMKDYKPRRMSKSVENLQPLADDYIKFIRFAQWKIEQNKEGIIGFIVNNNFLKGRIHRQMRLSLLRAFDKIFIYDLHGDRREDIPPEGVKDENVFGIQTGVCIIFLVKEKNTNKEKLADVYYGDIWGSAQKKFEILNGSDIFTFMNTRKKELKLKKILPIKPYYFLYPFEIDKKLQERWNQFISIREDLFYVAKLGVQTSRDSLCIAEDKMSLTMKILEIKKSTISTKELIKRNNWTQWRGNDWSEERINSYLANLRQIDDAKLQEEYFRIIHYRPFDFQYLFYFDGFVQVPARERCEHLKGNSSNEYALVVGRSGRPIKQLWNMAMFTSEIPDALLVSSRGSSIVCPIRYRDSKDNQLKYNIRSGFLNKFANAYQLSFENNNQEKKEIIERIMFYLYGILYSSNYRNKWNELLKYDMPRFPFPTNLDLFKEMSEKGEELARIHMMEASTISKIDEEYFARYPSPGNDIITKIEFDDENSIIKINDKQSFNQIDTSIWEFKIGGYQVLNQWLRRRVNKKLHSTEIKHFCQITGILKYTIQFMNEINNLYDQIELNPSTDIKVGKILDDFT